MLQEYVSFVFSVKEIKNMLWSNIKNSQERKPRTTGFIEGIYSCKKSPQDMRKKWILESEMIFFQLLFDEIMTSDDRTSYVARK